VNQPDPCSPLYLVQGDRNQLTRLFTNLLGNAIQYTPSGGEVHITLTTLKRNNDTQTAVQIRDTGVGIPSNAIPHLFDRFYQVDSSRSHRTGSGLGLAIARAIAENHQGQIQLTSTPGEGTIVTVTLPDLSET